MVDDPLMPILVPIEGDIPKSNSVIIPIKITTEPISAPEDGTEDSKFTLSERSLKAMEGVRADLIKVATRAIQLTTQDFVITQGTRTIEQQRKYVAEGKSRTMHSRHLVGCAIDFVDYPDFSYNTKKMKVIADAFKAAAKELNIPIHWGGDWTGFVDTSHIELDRQTYPD